MRFKCKICLNAHLEADKELRCHKIIFDLYRKAAVNGNVFSLFCEVHFSHNLNNIFPNRGVKI